MTMTMTKAAQKWFSGASIPKIKTRQLLAQTTYKDTLRDMSMSMSIAHLYSA